MKRISLSFLCIAALVGCASERKPPPKVVTVRQAPAGVTMPRHSHSLESARYGEIVKAYPVGRYIDPNDPSVMHESHVIYRDESTAKWNLHPNAPVRVPLGPAVASSQPARATHLPSSQSQSELASQRAHNVEAADLNKQMSGMVDKMQGMMKEVQNRLQQTQDMNGKVEQLQHQIDDLRLQNEEQRGAKQNKSTGSGTVTSGDSAKVATGGGPVGVPAGVPGGVPSGPPGGAATGMSGANN